MFKNNIIQPPADTRDPLKALAMSFLFMILIGCSSSKKNCPAGQNGIKAGSGPKQIYVQEYYVYRRGKYEFVRGHYRWVLFPKSYARRSLKGYVTNPERSASIR